MYRSLLIVMALMLLPVAAVCETLDWQWEFGGARLYGTSSTASDGYDPLDTLPPSGGTSHVGVYHQKGVDGWTGSTGLYMCDYRAPLEMLPGTSKTWRIYVWEDPAYPYDFTGINWFGGGVSQETIDRIEFRLTYVRPAVGVVDNGMNAVGSYKILNDYWDGGTWGNFPAGRVTNGLDGYIFDLAATVIPEPSSLLALLAGLGGLGGMIWRRSFGRLRMR